MRATSCGVHTTTALTRRVETPEAAAALMTRLREVPPRQLAGVPVIVTDLAPRTDALVFSGGDDVTSVRVVTRPSGTEPKLKSYIEIRCAGELTVARDRAKGVQHAVAAAVAGTVFQQAVSRDSPAGIQFRRELD